ncbi:MAG TPA: glycosyl hydrolase family 18 protein [Chloroflexia bacterium]|jgi:chitinase|nr:glycosyl hydrolase family 18 protein [Chloroflexia bacterium]
MNGPTEGKELFLAYWQGYTPSGTGPQDSPTLEQTPEFVDIIALAFAGPLPGSSITTEFLTSQNTKESILAGARFLQARGQKVVMSLIDNQACPWTQVDPQRFAASVKSIVIDEWGLDGVDLDNENPDQTPGQAFADVVHAIRQAIGTDKTISYPAYQPDRDQSFLVAAKQDLDFVSTMAYWLDADGQIALYEQYATMVGDDKVLIGVRSGYAGDGRQSTPIEAVPTICQYEPSGGHKGGVMLWNLTLDIPQYTQLPKFAWSNMIEQNLLGPVTTG